MMRNVLKSFVRFVRLLRHEPPENPAMREISAAADRVGGAMHSRSDSSGGGGAAFHSGGRTADKLFGNELAEGHKKARKNTPPPKAQ